MLLFLQERGSMLLLSLFLAMALCIYEFLRADFQQILKFNRFSQVLLIRSVILTLSILCLIGFFGIKIQAWHALTAQILASFIVSIPLVIKRKLFAGLFYLKKTVYLSRSVFAGKYRYLIGYSIVLAFFGRLDVFMLRSLSEAHDLSTYGSAFRYYGFLLMALESAKSVYLPVIQSISTIKGMNEIFLNHQKYVLLSIPIIAFGCLISQWIIPWVDNGRYPDAPTVFIILSVSAFMSFAFSPHVTVIMKMEKFFFLFLLMIFCFSLNFGLNFFLIPVYKAIGAAYATLLSFLCVNGAIFLYSRKLRKI
jgi:O-antigen/teichoic acid export membrane protein